MPRPVALAVLIATCTSFASPPALAPDEKMGAKLLGIAGEGFRIREMDHFTICYDTPYEAIRPLIGRLEATYNAIQRFCEGIGLGTEPPSERFGVLLFDRHEDFARHCERVGMSTATVMGFYDQRTNLAVFGNVLNTPQLSRVNAEIEEVQKRLERLREDPEQSQASRAEQEALRQRASNLRARRDRLVERFNRFVLQHEAAHQVLFNVGVHVRGADNPLWLVEGLACQFEVPESLAARGLGRINHMRLADLRDALGVPWDTGRVSGDEPEAAFASKRLVPLARFISEPALFTNPDENVAFRYAQAWGLVHYLTRRHHKALAAYLRQLGTRKPGVAVGSRREIDEFESQFGPLDAGFQQEWFDYMLELRLDRSEAGRQPGPDP